MQLFIQGHSHVSTLFSKSFYNSIQCGSGTYNVLCINIRKSVWAVRNRIFPCCSRMPSQRGVACETTCLGSSSMVLCAHYSLWRHYMALGELSEPRAWSGIESCAREFYPLVRVSLRWWLICVSHAECMRIGSFAVGMQRWMALFGTSALGGESSLWTLESGFVVTSLWLEALTVLIKALTCLLFLILISCVGKLHYSFHNKNCLVIGHFVQSETPHG